MKIPDSEPILNYSEGESVIREYLDSPDTPYCHVNFDISLCNTCG